MGGQCASLSGVGGSQVEVEDASVSTCLTVLLNQVAVDDAARGRVAHTVAFLHKESLSDPLVHDHHRDFRLLSHLIVQVRDHTPELRKFLGKDHVALSVRNTIAVDDEVGWLESLMGLLKASDGLADQSAHLIVDDLSSFGDKQVVRVILTHGFVGGGSESND